MSINREEQSSNKSNIEFKDATILALNDGTPVVKEKWLEKNGSQTGAKEIHVFDSLGQLLTVEITEGTGGHIMSADVTSKVTKEKNGLPIEIIQVEESGNPLLNALDSYINPNGQDLANPVQLGTNKIELVWNFERKQLSRTIESEVTRYGSEKNVFSPKTERRFLYDEEGRLIRQTTTHFYGEDEIELSHIDEKEYKAVGENNNFVLVTTKEFQINRRENQMELAGATIHVIDKRNKSLVGFTRYFNAKLDYVDKKFGNILETRESVKERGERGDLVPATLEINSFNLKNTDNF